MSVFNVLSLHYAYKEFVSRVGKSAEKSKFFPKDSQLPVISSECPGWVCYAEKRCGELAVPHMSNVKSGQQLFGQFMHVLDPTSKVVTIMPCYDKKLEAVRPDFRFGQTVDSNSCKEVDTVLATHELLELLDR